MELVDKKIKTNEYFIDKKPSDRNPDFADYKLNNYQAFRAMAEIIANDGNINSPNFHPTLKKYLETEFPGEDGKNAKTLSRKVNEFVKQWPNIKKHAAFKASITSMATSFFSFWDEYPEAIKQYRTREDFPTYMDVNQYLNMILDASGKFVEPTVEDQRKFTELATNWRMDVENQYGLYKQGESENAEQ